MTYKGLLIGDSVLYGAINDTRHNPTPKGILNAEQAKIYFAYDLSKPGASFAGLQSNDSAARQASGLPLGQTLDHLLTHTDADCVLFNLGGNDKSLTDGARSELVTNILTVSQTCLQNRKIYGFVGVIDVCVKQAMTNAGIADGDWALTQACQIACSAEVLRQTCLTHGLPYIDIRNKVPVTLNDITGDVVHPDERYCQAIFSEVARAIDSAL